VIKRRSHTKEEIEGVRGCNEKAIAIAMGVEAMSRKRLMPFFNKITSEIIALGKDNGVALDIGTGHGLLPVLLARKARNMKVIGLDPADAMLEVGRRNAAQEKVGDRVSFQKGEGKVLPFSDCTFDLVLTTNSFHHWDNPVGSLNEIARVLKRDGVFYMADLRRNYLGLLPMIRLFRSLNIDSIRAAYTVEEICSLMSQTKLKTLDIKNSFLWIYLKAGKVV